MTRPRLSLPRVGRVLLWTLAAILLLRGITGLIGPATPQAQAPGPTPTPASQAWPDDQARAFAVDFADQYLTLPSDPVKAALQLQRFTTPELLSQILPTTHGDPPPAPALAVARAVRLSDTRAVITVAAGTRQLAVPVERNRGGEFVVFDAPAFTAAPPPPLQTSEERADGLGPEETEIHDVITRFLTAYMAGDAQAAAYYAIPGSHLGALQAPLRFRALQDLQRLDDGTILATVTASTRSCKKHPGAGCGVTYPLRYRARLEHRERWLLASITTEGKDH